MGFGNMDIHMEMESRHGDGAFYDFTYSVNTETRLTHMDSENLLAISWNWISVVKW